MTDPKSLRARADALDALRPGESGDGWNLSIDGQLIACSTCNGIRDCSGHWKTCHNAALSTALHDGAQALRREAAMMEWLTPDGFPAELGMTGQMLGFFMRAHPDGDAEALGEEVMRQAAQDVRDKLAALHADPAGQER